MSPFVRQSAAVIAAATMLLALSGCITIRTGSSGDGPGTSSDGGSTPVPSGSAAPLDETPGDAPAQARISGNVAGQVDYTATTQYLSAVITHADTVWSNWFKANGYAEPYVLYEIVQPGAPVTTKCNVGTDEQPSYTVDSTYQNALYCDGDYNGVDQGTIIIPVETFAKMWTGDIFSSQVVDLKKTGDFAAAIIAAHEFGHHVQFELSEDTGVAGPINPNNELIADCFAGVWAYALNLDNGLEQGDVDEALNALAAIGDTQGSHGTSEERDNAFLIGLNGTTDNPQGGVPFNCTRSYWPEFPGD